MKAVFKTAGGLASTGLLVLLLTVSGPNPAEAVEAFYDCVFARGANQTRAATLTTPVQMRFGLDNATGEAAQYRDGDRFTVLVVRGIAGLSFVEALSTGVVNVTTITTTGNSVHSRHDIRGGTDIVAIQYYGTCTTS